MIRNGLFSSESVCPDIAARIDGFEGAVYPDGPGL